MCLWLCTYSWGREKSQNTPASRQPWWQSCPPTDQPRPWQRERESHELVWSLTDWVIKWQCPHMKCVVSRMVLPSLCLANRSQVALLAYGSSPEVGSSSTTILEPPIRAMPTLASIRINVIKFTNIMCIPELPFHSSRELSSQSTALIFKQQVFQHAINLFPNSTNWHALRCLMWKGSNKACSVQNASISLLKCLQIASLYIQWNPSIWKPLNWGHLYKQDTFFSPKWYTYVLNESTMDVTCYYSSHAWYWVNAEYTEVC